MGKSLREILAAFTGTIRQKSELPPDGKLLRHVGKQLVLIHSLGVATLQLSSSKEPSPEPTLRTCQGLNSSSIAAAAFQGTKGKLGRYFALTSEGEILTLGNQALTNCKV